MVFNFTQFWVDGRPENVHFWISHIDSSQSFDVPGTPGSASALAYVIEV